MRTTIVMLALVATLGIGSAYAADAAAPGASISTPGSESKGNPITSPDQGTAGEDASPAEETGTGEAKTVPGGTVSTPGSESKGNPIPPPQ
jgi:hypothetical protein